MGELFLFFPFYQLKLTEKKKVLNGPKGINKLYEIWGLSIVKYLKTKLLAKQTKTKLVVVFVFVL